MMSSFRKHANADTQWLDSCSGKRPSGAKKAPRHAAILSCILLVTMSLTAAPVSYAQTTSNSDDKAAHTTADAKEVTVPMRMHFAGTRERPLVVATIGEFPADLGDAGKDFLTREFFERFITDTLQLGGLESRPALKLALLPQNSATERQCSFTLDDVEGHMTVVLMDRRVLIVCAFKLSKQEKPPLRLASARRFDGSYAG